MYVFLFFMDKGGFCAGHFISFLVKYYIKLEGCSRRGKGDEKH